MKKRFFSMIMFIGICLFGYAGFCKGWPAQNRIYRELTESQIDSCHVTKMKKDHHFQLLIKYTDESYQVETDSGYSALICVVTKVKDGNEIHFERKNNQIYIREGDKQKVVRIGDEPWFQTPFAMIPFIQSSARKITFWVATVSDEI